MSCRFGTICPSFAGRVHNAVRTAYGRPIPQIGAVLAACCVALAGIARSRRATEESP